MGVKKIDCERGGGGGGGGDVAIYLSLNLHTEFFEILRYPHNKRGCHEPFLTGKVSVDLPLTVKKICFARYIKISVSIRKLVLLNTVS